jgi:hypothetical protein
MGRVEFTHPTHTILKKELKTMEITGKLIEKLPQQTGQGRNGAWVKQEFIIETPDQFPRKVCIALWGDKARDIETIAIGESIKASVNVESREFSGKWYTDVKAWRIEKLGSTSGTTPTPPPMPSVNDFPSEIPPMAEDAPDDLPF